jgi:hypothetical protein
MNDFRKAAGSEIFSKFHQELSSGSLKPVIFLFAANGNVKPKLIFLGRQMINGSRRLLFQQTCPSMSMSIERLPLSAILKEDHRRQLWVFKNEQST